jgi:FkbM family methyltransferase
VAFLPDGVCPEGALGPLRGMSFRVGPITGLSAWYSGAEREHHRAFREHLRPGSVAIDVGANWGLHTLYLSRLVGETGRVLALEPFPPAFEELEWHLATNGCRNVRALKVAASDANGQARFIPGDSPSTGRLNFGGAAPADTGMTVPTRTLDAVVEEARFDRLDLVKIDVEGAEGQVLLGAGATIDRFRPVLVIDLHTPEQDV